MLERLVEQKQAIVSTITKHNIDLDEITNREWKYIESLIEILEPFETITNELSGSKYCTISLIIPMIQSIKIALRIKRSKNDQFRNICECLLRSLDKRFSYLEEDKNITLATILDPRIKDTCFGCTTNKSIALTNLEDELNELYNNSPSSLSTESSLNNGFVLETEIEPPKKKNKSCVFGILLRNNQAILTIIVQLKLRLS